MKTKDDVSHQTLDFSFGEFRSVDWTQLDPELLHVHFVLCIKN